MHPAIDQHRKEISSICKRYRVRKLDVFGSAARKVNFKINSSDADFLIEFEPDVQVGLDQLMGIKTELEKLLRRNVDLIEPEAVLNPFVKASIQRHQESVYAA
jgi:predicted nucleotidyltransferase